MTQIYTNVSRILRTIFHAVHILIRLYLIATCVAIALVVIRYTVPETASMPSFWQFVDEWLIPNGNRFFIEVMKYLR